MGVRQDSELTNYTRDNLDHLIYSTLTKKIRQPIFERREGKCVKSYPLGFHRNIYDPHSP